MISAGDFRNGVIIDIEGVVYKIIDVRHVKPESGSPFVRVKMKNIFSGELCENTFQPTDMVHKAHIDRKDMQFLYLDEKNASFMDIDSYDQIEIPLDVIGDALRLVKENDTVTICSYEGTAFSVETPLFVELLVIETESEASVDTSTNSTKPAKVETGAIVQVPAFVNTYDLIKIDTRTGEFLSRV